MTALRWKKLREARQLARNRSWRARSEGCSRIFDKLTAFPSNLFCSAFLIWTFVRSNRTIYPDFLSHFPLFLSFNLSLRVFVKNYALNQFRDSLFLWHRKLFKHVHCSSVLHELRIIESSIFVFFITCVICPLKRKFKKRQRRFQQTCREFDKYDKKLYKKYISFHFSFVVYTIRWIC